MSSVQPFSRPPLQAKSATATARTVTRYLVCRRKVEKTPPGAPKVHHEPRVILVTTDFEAARDQLYDEIDRMRKQRYTCDRPDPKKPYHWDCFRLTIYSGYDEFQLYVAEIGVDYAGD